MINAIYIHLLIMIFSYLYFETHMLLKYHTFLIMNKFLNNFLFKGRYVNVWNFFGISISIAH